MTWTKVLQSPTHTTVRYLANDIVCDAIVTIVAYILFISKKVIVTGRELLLLRLHENLNQQAKLITMLRTKMLWRH